MIRTRSRTILILSVVGLVCGMNIQYAGAQGEPFPSKPIQLILPGSPGSSSDLPLRALATAAEKILGRPITCLNDPGAGGSRALSILVKEKPDGYTLGLLTLPALVRGHTDKLNYSMVNDFTPVVLVQRHPVPFAVRKDAPWKTWRDYAQYAKDNPGKATVGVFGSRSTAWLALTQIERADNVKFVYVPFPGSGEALTATLGGHVSANTMTSATVHAKSGELKLLMFFSEKRLEAFPDVPVARELYKLGGVGITGGFSAIVGPKGIPAPVLAILDDAFRKAMQDPDFLKVINKFELVASYEGPADLAKEIKETDEELKEILAKGGK